MGTRLIINPAAGGNQCERQIHSRLALLRESWPDLECCTSKSAEHVTELAAEAVTRGVRRVLVAGGDGTVHYAANALVGTETALGVLPVGTGNDLAVSVGVPKDLDAAIAVLANNQVRAIDVGEVGGRVFCCVLGVGMDTMALETINNSRIPRGRLLYSLATLGTIFRYDPAEISLGYDNHTFKGPIMFAAITNTPSYAGGFNLTPAAVVDDGMLDVCIIPTMGTLRLLRTFAGIFSGAHTRERGVVIGRTTTAWLRSEHAIPITLDGELTELTTDQRVQIIPGGLKVLGSPPSVDCA